jgi:5-hydroxyisourate hydrolase
MASLSTHVLDTALGRPAPGVPVTLEHQGVTLGHAVTDRDGRVRDWGTSVSLASGSYRLVFAVGEYFGARGVTGFYPTITIEFLVGDDPHYHVPLLLSPFGYSTYRGS